MDYSADSGIAELPALHRPGPDLLVAGDEQQIPSVRPDHFEDVSVLRALGQLWDVWVPDVEDGSSRWLLRQSPPDREDVLIGEEAADLTQRLSSAPRPLPPLA